MLNAGSYWVFLWLGLAAVVGAPLLGNPKRLWWALVAWRYKNPDANEPSGALYATMRLVGLVVVIVAIVAAGLQYARHRAYEEDAAKAARQKEQSASLPREDRGLIPIIGYSKAPSSPPGFDSVSLWASVYAGDWYGTGKDSCTVVVDSRDDGTGAYVVTAHLEWAPSLASDLPGSGQCHAAALRQEAPRKVETKLARSGARMLTDGPVMVCQTERNDTHCDKGRILPPEKGRELPELDGHGSPHH